MKKQCIITIDYPVELPDIDSNVKNNLEENLPEYLSECFEDTGKNVDEHQIEVEVSPVTESNLVNK